MEVLGIGAPIVDHIVYVSHDQLAAISSKIGSMEIIDYSLFIKLYNEYKTRSLAIPGGSCANTIRGLAHFGHSCGFMGKIGTDEIGSEFLKSLLSLNIKSHCISISTHTGQVLSFVTPDGERTCRTYLGAAQEMTSEDLTPFVFQQVPLVHIEGYTLSYPNLTKQAMEYAKKAGALISFDLGNFEVVNTFKKDLLKLLLKYVDLCFCNQEEIEALFGKTPREGCSQLNELCQIAVVHLKNGAWIGDNGREFYSPACPVEHPLDTTGAGDLFCSGFLHGYLRKKPAKMCAHYGALAGAAAVQVQGTALSDTDWERLSKLLT